jgi:hypothetical protein
VPGDDRRSKIAVWSGWRRGTNRSFQRCWPGGWNVLLPAKMVQSGSAGIIPFVGKLWARRGHGTPSAPLPHQRESGNRRSAAARTPRRRSQDTSRWYVQRLFSPERTRPGQRSDPAGHP